MQLYMHAYMSAPGAPRDMWQVLEPQFGKFVLIKDIYLDSSAPKVTYQVVSEALYRVDAM